MSNLLNGNADLSPDMALRFEQAFGLGAETLLRMQTAHDLAEARQDADRLRVERVTEPAARTPLGIVGADSTIALALIYRAAA